jgi:hypothetical protein
MATAAVVAGILILFFAGKWVFYPGSTESPDVALRQEEPRAEPEEPAKSPEAGREQEPPPSKPQKSPRPEPQAKVSEKPYVRRPAEPGIYQTLRRTPVRSRPNSSATVLDELGSNTRLNVVGSEGDWLIVRSNKLKTVVYVKRDDAMFLPREKPAESYEEVEARWRKVEADIHEAFGRWNVMGVSVAFIGDTAYLNGHVKTEDERLRAEQAARTIPEVERIYNGVWVNP